MNKREREKVMLRSEIDAKHVEREAEIIIT